MLWWELWQMSAHGLGQLHHSGTRIPLFLTGWEINMPVFWPWLWPHPFLHKAASLPGLWLGIHSLCMAPDFTWRPVGRYNIENHWPSEFGSRKPQLANSYPCLMPLACVWLNRKSTWFVLKRPDVSLSCSQQKRDGVVTIYDDGQGRKKDGHHRSPSSSDLAYGILDIPPWYLCIILGIQVMPPSEHWVQRGSDSKATSVHT